MVSEPGDPVEDEFGDCAAFFSFLSDLTVNDSSRDDGEAAPDSTLLKPVRAANLSDRLTADVSTAERCNAAVPVRFDAQGAATERVREKNRRNQRRYRQRCKAQIENLNKDIDGISYRLREAMGRHRCLKSEHHALLHKLHKLTSPAASCLPPPPYCSTQEQQIASCGGSRGTSGVPHSAVARWEHQVVQRRVSSPGRDADYRQQYATQSIPRSLSSFDVHAAISYTDVVQHMLPRSHWRTCKHAVLAPAISEYQWRTCQNLPHGPYQVSDVCWFFQWPVHPGLVLSYSAGVNSPECSLSASLTFAATTTESMFLVLEHERLMSDIDPSYLAPLHPGLPFPGHVDTPKPPDPQLLQQLWLRCDINGRHPLADGVEQVVRPMLRKYRPLLPRHVWRSACMASMRVLSVPVPSAADPANPGAHMATDDGHEGMPWALLDTAIAAMTQQMACITHSVMQEEDELELAPARSLEQVHARMHVLIGTVGTIGNLVMQAAPLTGRHVLIAHFLALEQDTVRARRTQMKAYTMLELTREQRLALSEKWSCWCRRRVALGRRTAAALHRLHTALPSVSSLPTHLFTLLSCFTAVSEEPESEIREAQVSGLPSPASHAAGASLASVVTPDGSLDPAVVGSNRPQLVIDPRAPRPSAELLYISTDPLPAPATATASATTTAAGVRVEMDAIEGAVESGSVEAGLSAACTGTCMSTGDGNSCAATGHHPEPQQPHVHWVTSAHTMATKLMHAGSPSEYHSGPAEDDTASASAAQCREAAQASQRLNGGAPGSGGGRGVHRGAPARAHVGGAGGVGECALHSMSRQGATGDAGRHTQRCGAGSSVTTGAVPAPGPPTWAPVATPALSAAELASLRVFMCGEERPRLLGESGETVRDVYEAVVGLQEVHRSDEAMHYEFLQPFWELTEVQHARLMAAHVELCMPACDVMHLFRAAAEEARREDLFGARGVPTL